MHLWELNKAVEIKLKGVTFMKFYIYQGQLIKKDKACINLLDRGLLFGEGLFETIRIYNGYPFLIEKHIDRLEKGCKELGIKIDFSLLLSNIKIFIEANDLLEGSMRLSVTGGIKSSFLPSINSAGTYFITGQKGNPYPCELYDKGYTALVSKIKKNPYSPLVYLKSLNFTENMMAKKEAALSGYDEAIFLNIKHFLTEGSVTNIFIVKNEQLLTPAIKCGLLPGITREIIIDLCNENKMPVKESNLKLSDLLTAEEAFLTNSLMETMPLVKVNKHLISKGNPGAVTAHLTKLYKEKVKSYISP